MNKYFQTFLSKQIKKKHVSEQSCSSVRAFSNILAHLANLACAFSLILNRMNKLMFWFRHTNTRKHVSEQSWLSGWIILIILAHLAHLAQSYFSSFKYISSIEVFSVATTAFGGENFPLFLEIVLTKDYFIL